MVNNMENAKLLIAAKANINLASPYSGLTPLMMAATRGHLNVAKSLIKHGADVNVVNKQNKTALTLAMERHCSAFVKLLLEKGADLHLKDNLENKTLLMEAAEKGFADVVQLLLEKGEDVNAREAIYGRTALMFAAASGSKETIKALLEKGADLNLATTEGQTALDFARQNGRSNLVELLSTPLVSAEAAVA